jgi:hypothetical protein
MWLISVMDCNDRLRVLLSHSLVKWRIKNGIEEDWPELVVENLESD